MTKAEYSPALIGHFALASDAYAHFTSPIRRYPDLIVHRALAAYLPRTNNGADAPRDDAGFAKLGRTLRDDPLCPDDEKLTQVGRHCSGTEVNSSGAEDDLRRFLVLQLLEGKIGEQFPGVVTGVTNAGVFVQIDQYLAEGLVKTEDLPTGSDRPGSGRWKIDPKSGALVEQSTGRSFNIGDRIGCIVASVDLPARQMELLIADPTSREVGKVKKPLVALGDGGGIGHTSGAGFKPTTGGQRRSRKSKSRDKGKADHRSKRKGK
jgi:ribonuclease R